MDQIVNEVTTADASTAHADRASPAQTSSNATTELKMLDLTLVGGGFVSPCFA